MKISRIYRKYKVPPNLQNHLLWTAAVGAKIVNGWQGRQKINREIIIRTMLLHDLANIVKFDFDHYLHLLGKEEKRINHWKQVQKEFIQEYGHDEHLARDKIAQEIGASDKIIFIFKNTGSSNLDRTLKSANWYLKICSYADLRVGPFGVVTINQRFDEVIARYKNRNHELSDIEAMEKKRQYSLKIEKQIQKKVNFNLAEISDQSIKTYSERLKDFQF